MPAQSVIRSAVTSVTTTITVAAGVFAAGHLGELTRIVPFELADAVLEEEAGLERRVRLAPSRAGCISCWRCACSRGPVIGEYGAS